MKWAYGITTVAERLTTYLPTTLQALEAGGFPEPHLFVDGLASENGCILDAWPALSHTVRKGRVGVHGNWILSFYELFLRNHDADRYVVFQDDIICARNLRGYLEAVAYPDGLDGDPPGYLNLLTFPSNQLLAPKDECGGGRGAVGFYPSNQLGKGAVALVFNRAAAVTLLSARTMVERSLDRTDALGSRRGTVNVDGGIVTAMNAAGYREYVHNPSLVQHVGFRTTIPGHEGMPQAISFRGVNFDALTLLRTSSQEYTR